MLSSEFHLLTVYQPVSFSDELFIVSCSFVLQLHINSVSTPAAINNSFLIGLSLCYIKLYSISDLVIRMVSVFMICLSLSPRAKSSSSLIPIMMTLRLVSVV